MPSLSPEELSERHFRLIFLHASLKEESIVCKATHDNFIPLLSDEELDWLVARAWRQVISWTARRRACLVIDPHRPSDRNKVDQLLKQGALEREHPRKLIMSFATIYAYHECVSREMREQALKVLIEDCSMEFNSDKVDTMNPGSVNGNTVKKRESPFDRHITESLTHIVERTLLMHVEDTTHISHSPAAPNRRNTAQESSTPTGLGIRDAQGLNNTAAAPTANMLPNGYKPNRIASLPATGAETLNHNASGSLPTNILSPPAKMLPPIQAPPAPTHPPTSTPSQHAATSAPPSTSAPENKGPITTPTPTQTNKRKSPHDALPPRPTTAKRQASNGREIRTKDVPFLEEGSRSLEPGEIDERGRPEKRGHGDSQSQSPRLERGRRQEGREESVYNRR